MLLFVWFRYAILYYIILLPFISFVSFTLIFFIVDDINIYSIEVEQYAQTERLQSEAALTEAINRAKAIELEADAESKVYEQLQQKRQFDLQYSSLKVCSI